MSDLPSTSRRQEASGSSGNDADPSQPAPSVYVDKRKCTTKYVLKVEQSPQGSEIESTTSRKTTEPATNVELLYRKLIEVSRKQASKLCGAEEFIHADQKINIAPLELSTQAKNLDLVDESGHYHHRKEITEVFNKPPTRNIHYSQLFNEAQTLAQNEKQKYCSTLDAKEEYQLANGNIVGVVGQAGIGKTTLTRLLVRDVLNQRLYDADFIFYLRLRDLDYTKEMNLIQFLTNNSEFSNKLTKQNLTQLLEKLSESTRVCIICDGFDEATVKGKSKRLAGNCSIYDEVKAETFIKHLLSGNLLPRAKKLFTSRPRQLFHLHNSYRPHFIVNVLGLNGEAQKQICRDVCEIDHAITQVFKFVNDRPDLKSFCYVPANCIMVMYCINQNFQSGSLAALERMDSITTILIATLGIFIENGHLRGETFQTTNLSCMAYTAFVSKRLFFEQKDLTEAGISTHQATTFLTTRLGKKATSMKLWEGIATVKSYFSHLLLHEFFVALYLILFMKTKKFGKVLSDFKKNRYEMVAKFSFGLCNSTTQNYLKDLIPSEELDLSHYDEKKDMLKKLALKRVASAKNFTDLLQVCSWIYELRDDQTTITAASKLRDEIEVSSGILPSDIPSFQYVLQLRKTPLSLIIPHPDLERERRKSFFVALDAILQSANVKIKELQLQWNDIDEDEAVYLASSLQSVTVLNVHQSGLNAQGVKALSSAIKHMANPMQKLDLSWNAIVDDAAVHLATCIHNVETLELCQCEIGPSGVKSLSHGIMKRNQPMKKLDLYGNRFGDEGAKYLQACLHKIKSLDVRNCGISGDVRRSLKSNSAGCEVTHK